MGTSPQHVTALNWTVFRSPLNYREESAASFASVRVSIATKRHQDHGGSYKGKHLIGAGLQFGPLSSWWDLAGRRQTWCWRGS